ncbi:MAG: hypothetical protein IJH12_10555 [Clostridia bacterium]|nr:hypothetical protein [Clostridia bacterium]
MENKIVDMYFNKQMKPVEIARALQIKKYKVTRVLQKDTRYVEEKQKRMIINKINHNEKTKDYMKRKRKFMQFINKIDDLILKNMHKQASFELSKGSKLSDMAYRNWNISAYTYDKCNRRFVFKNELGRSADVPKYIKLRK